MLSSDKREQNPALWGAAMTALFRPQPFYFPSPHAARGRRAHPIVFCKRTVIIKTHGMHKGYSISDKIMVKCGEL
jgi:hypothetical protein